MSKKTEGIWSNAFGHMINFKANDRMNKNRVIDILIVYADKFQLVELQNVELASKCCYRQFEIRQFDSICR